MMMADMTKDTPQTGPEKLLRRCAIAGVAMCCLGMLALVVIQYGTPHPFAAWWGVLSRVSVLHFQHTLLGRTLPQWSKLCFGLSFKLALGTAWAGYAVAMGAAIKGAKISPKTILAASAAVCLVTAVICPPALCKDPYAYVAYGRLLTMYGLNPYSHSQMEVGRFGDPTVKYLFWNMVCPYGPVWTSLCAAIIWATSWAGLWGQVVAFKLAASAALIGFSIVGSRVAEKMTPGRGNLTLLGTALNPLFILEAAGSGHNEFLMMGLVLLAALWLQQRRKAAGFLALGASIGVKFVTIAILPWLALRMLRGQRLRQAGPLACLMAVIALAPTVLLYVPFWDGGAPLSGMRTQTRFGIKTDRPPARSDIRFQRERTSNFLDMAGSQIASRWWLILLYFGLSAWVVKSKDSNNWMTAWAIFSLCLCLCVVRIKFPWYLTWPWMVSLLRWNRAHAYLSMMCFALAITLTMCYGIAVR